MTNAGQLFTSQRTGGTIAARLFNSGHQLAGGGQ
jgi:hypothetical protein